MTQHSSDDDDEDESEDRDEEEEREDIELSFSVQVLDSDGDPVKNAKVEAVFSENDPISDFFKGVRKVEYTDEDGCATFDCLMSHSNVAFNCHDERFGPYSVDEGDCFTLNV